MVKKFSLVRAHTPLPSAVNFRSRIDEQLSSLCAVYLSPISSPLNTPPITSFRSFLPLSSLVHPNHPLILHHLYFSAHTQLYFPSSIKFNHCANPTPPIIVNFIIRHTRLPQSPRYRLPHNNGSLLQHTTQPLGCLAMASVEARKKEFHLLYVPASFAARHPLIFRSATNQPETHGLSTHYGRQISFRWHFQPQPWLLRQ